MKEETKYVYRASKTDGEIAERILIEDKGAFLLVKRNRIAEEKLERSESNVRKYFKTKLEAVEWLEDYYKQTIKDLENRKSYILAKEAELKQYMKENCIDE